MSEVSNTPQDERPAAEKRTTLTLQDLGLMVQIIETGTQRGAWKPDELSSVGGLYDRITKFLEAANQAAQQQKATTPETE